MEQYKQSKTKNKASSYLNQKLLEANKQILGMTVCLLSTIMLLLCLWPLLPRVFFLSTLLRGEHQLGTCHFVFLDFNSQSSLLPPVCFLDGITVQHFNWALYLLNSLQSIALQTHGQLLRTRLSSPSAPKRQGPLLWRLLAPNLYSSYLAGLIAMPNNIEKMKRHSSNLNSRNHGDSYFLGVTWPTLTLTQMTLRVCIPTEQAALSPCVWPTDIFVAVMEVSSIHCPHGPVCQWYTVQGWSLQFLTSCRALMLGHRIPPKKKKKTRRQHRPVLAM